MEAIEYYVKGAFRGVRETPEVVEQQEELVADMTAKVADLVEQGRSAEEALGIAIASVGDLSALVSEFESADPSAEAVPEVAVYATQLDLHAVAASFAIGAAVMVASTALGAWSRLVDPTAGWTLLGVLGAGIWWVRQAYVRFQESPDEIESRPADQRARFRGALLLWAGSAFAAFVLNLISGTGFWAWPIWVAGGTWALAVKVESSLMQRESFLVTETEG